MRWRTAVAAAVGLCCVVQGHTQAYFADANDSALRADVVLLADEGVIAVPVSAWPIPAVDLIGALERVDPSSIADLALQSALLRARRKLQSSQDGGDWRIREIQVSAAARPPLRDYGTPIRDPFEVSATGGTANERWSLDLTATAVGSPDDGRHLRVDGSALSARVGNWVLSANQMDRWWGPGWDGSLILSTNARPMPALSIDRARSDRFGIPILAWLGPWRFSAFLARADKYRDDVDESLFLGMRATFKPLQILEIGLVRSAQFCGRGRKCNATIFRNVLFGDDNVGLRVSPEDEPGNQMAGMDVRIVSPIKRLPMAIYGQFVGEDNSSSGIPERYLGLMGAESWLLMDSGDGVRGYLEYANTNCKFSSSSMDRANCAYRQSIFYAGYRFHGRNLGHSTDADSESWGLGATWTRPSGNSWSVHLRRALLDRRGGSDPYNPLTSGPGETQMADVSWRGAVLGQALEVQIGMVRQNIGIGRFDSDAYGGVVWKQAF